VSIFFGEDHLPEEFLILQVVAFNDHRSSIPPYL
jgi:hypothetical protein